MIICDVGVLKRGKIIDADGFEMVTRQRGGIKRKVANTFGAQGVCLAYLPVAHSAACVFLVLRQGVSWMF